MFYQWVLQLLLIKRTRFFCIDFFSSPILINMKLVHSKTKTVFSFFPPKFTSRFYLFFMFCMFCDTFSKHTDKISIFGAPAQRLCVPTTYVHIALPPFFLTREPLSGKFAETNTEVASAEMSLAKLIPRAQTKSDFRHVISAIVGL